MNSSGTLNVTVLNAQFAAQSDVARKNDVYILLRVGQTEVKTAAARAMGATPSWNQSFSFAVTTEQTIEVELHEEETGRTKMLAKNTVALPRASEPRALTQPLQLNDTEGRNVATVYLNIAVVPGTAFLSAFRHPTMSVCPPMGNLDARNYATYTQQVIGGQPPLAPVGGIGQTTFSTNVTAPYPPMQTTVGGYTQTTPIPGGYTQTTTFPNGYAQTTHTSTGYAQPLNYLPTNAGYGLPSMYSQTTQPGFTQPATYAQTAQTTQSSTNYAQSGVGSYTRPPPFVYGQTSETLGTTAGFTSPTVGTYAQTVPIPGGYAQTTPIPGGYAQTITYPNGYAQSTYTHSSSQVPPTTTVSYGPGNTTTSTTYSSSETAYQASQSSYSRVR